MSKTPFQGGTNFEIFSASGKNPEASIYFILLIEQKYFC